MIGAVVGDLQELGALAWGEAGQQADDKIGDKGAGLFRGDGAGQVGVENFEKAPHPGRARLAPERRVAFQRAGVGLGFIVEVDKVIEIIATSRRPRESHEGPTKSDKCAAPPGKVPRAPI